MSSILAGALVVVALISFFISIKPSGINSFFKGQSESGGQPGLLTLTLSQVTTWIFARSLMTAAILGYYYGIAGGIAYAAYYLSFFTGGVIVDQLRFKHGAGSIQEFIEGRFGTAGVHCYNLVIALRLMSEVFANLLVIGIIFGKTGSTAYITSIILLSLFTLVYSMIGGLRASLKTDVFQMSIFTVALAFIVIGLLSDTNWSFTAVLESSPLEIDHGWNLLLVALLQIWSYPMHDPVMMDRGFIADRQTTRRSFIHAGWISILCILAFSLLGVFAGIHALDNETMMISLDRLLGKPMMVLISFSLIISAVSTLDSTLSSAAKLTIIDMKLASPYVRNGRIAMALFMLGGLAFLFGGSKDLFSAVAVSGTASMFLFPVIIFSIFGNSDIPGWSYFSTFAIALLGAAMYYGEAGGHWSLIEPMFGVEHKYSKLLLISGLVMGLGTLLFGVGKLTQPPAPVQQESL